MTAIFRIGQYDQEGALNSVAARRTLICGYARIAAVGIYLIWPTRDVRYVALQCLQTFIIGIILCSHVPLREIRPVISFYFQNKTEMYASIIVYQRSGAELMQ